MIEHQFRYNFVINANILILFQLANLYADLERIKVVFEMLRKGCQVSHEIDLTADSCTKLKLYSYLPGEEDILCIDVRKYFKNYEGELCPTRRGVTISKEENIKKFLEFIPELITIIKSVGGKNQATK